MHALLFDGADDYVSIADNSRLTPSALTVAAWIKASAWAPEYWCGTIAGKEDWLDDDQRGFALRSGENGRLSFVLSIEGVWMEAVSGQVMAAGTWVHVAGTYDGSTIKVFVDGAEMGSTPCVGAINPSSYPLEIGRSPYETTRLFNGLVDDVRLYDRRLSVAEIQALAAGNHPSSSIATTTLGAPLGLTGDLALNCGTLGVGASSYPITVNGNLIRNGGVFDAGAGSVTFAGSGSRTLDTDVITLFDVVVDSGVTLATSAEVTVLGSLSNDGATREDRVVREAGAYAFGLADIVVELETPGSLAGLAVERFDQTHPGAMPGIQADGYWTVAGSGGGYSASLTLPHAGLARPAVCRDLDPGWDCAVDGFDSTTVWRDGIAELSDWTVGESMVDLAISKSDGHDTVAPGEGVTYTITAANTGSGDAIGATVSDVFPVALTGVSWTCEGAGGVRARRPAAATSTTRSTCRVGRA